jgi:riboflavin biosynthesis pyrimidine reductase
LDAQPEVFMEPGSLVTDDGTVLPPDPAEQQLRALYAVPPTTTMRLSMIQGADRGAVGLDGTSRSLNGPEDLRILRVARSWADVVIVGANTARTEGYGDIRLSPELQAARVASGLSPLPDLAIVTRNGRVPEGLDPERTWLISNEWGRAKDLDGPLARRVLIAGKREVDLGRAFNLLVASGYRRLLCEGGPQLARRFLDLKVVRDFCLTTSPRPAGRSPKVPPVPRYLSLEHRLTGGGFTIERWGL